MSMESIFKLSVLVNMIDRLSGPSATIQRSVNQTSNKFTALSANMANTARDGLVLAGAGTQIAAGAAAPVKAIFGTQDALAELGIPIFVCLCQSLLVVVIGCASKMSYLQKDV